MSTLRTFAAAIVALLLAGCASTGNPRTGLEAEDLVCRPHASETDEIICGLAEDFLQASLLESDIHRVDDKVITRGYHNIYTISSNYGNLTAYGDAEVPVRVQEIRALATLDEITNSSIFISVAKGVVTGPFKLLGRLFRHPVDTVSGIPAGGWHLATRYAEMVTGSRGEFEDGVASELLGISSVKRAYARLLNVDVYSSNSALQEKLNRVAYVAFASGIPFGFARKTALPGEVTTGLGLLRLLSLGAVLKARAPEDVRRMNRASLRQMEIDEALIGRFLGKPVFSPRHETIIVQSLAEIEGAANRGGFLELAVRANSEEEALYFQRAAQLMLGYHRNIAPVVAVIALDGVPLFYTAEGNIVAALPLDFFRWTRHSAELWPTIVRSVRRQREVSRFELWITGRASPRAIERANALGMTIYEHVSAKLLTTPRSLAGSIRSSPQ